MDEQEQKSIGQDMRNAASAGKSAITAAAKGAAGDVAGAAIEVAKNPTLRKLLLGIPLLVIFLITACLMLIGSSITGLVHTIAENFGAAYEEAWAQEGVNSRGSLLALYGYDIMTGQTASDRALTVAITNALIDTFDTDPHTVNGMDATNSDIGPEYGMEMLPEDYQLTIEAITDQAALASADGALQKRMSMIMQRVDERGNQLTSWATGQYVLDSIGIQIADAFASVMTDPFLYNGTGDVTYDIDTSVFDLTDVQALKIYALYSIQHDVAITDIDMWDLMDYCGWYSTVFKDLDTSVYQDPTSPNIYNSEFGGSFTDDFGGFSAGTSLDEIYKLDDPYVPYWSGTCAPQWYYEEIAQLQKMNADYEALEAKIAAEKEKLVPNQEAIKKMESQLAQMPHFAEDAQGNIILSNFTHLDEVKPYGIIDKIYTGTKATLAVSHSEYFGVDKASDEFLAGLTHNLRALWDEAFGEQSKYTPNGNLVYRDTEDNHSVTLYNTSSDSIYYLINQNTGYMTTTLFGGGAITFGGLNPDTSYAVYRQDRIPEEPAQTVPDKQSPESITPMSYIPEQEGAGIVLLGTVPAESQSGSHSEANTVLLANNEAPEYADPVWIDELTTFVSSANNKAYTLNYELNISYSARSIDDLIYGYLGLWPDSLTNTVIGKDGIEYAAGFEGNDLLRKTWTDTYTDPATGKVTTLTFERQQGFQAEAYEDIVTGIATLLGYELNGLFAQDYGYGGTIVSMAQQELAYYQTNNLGGGSRYWELCSNAKFGDPDRYDKTAPWCVAFVNACAYNCGFTDEWYGDGMWPYWVGGFYTALVEGGHAIGHNTADNYVPVPGDLILFGSGVGCAEPDHIGIVEFVDNEGRVHTIEGNSGNSLKRCTYDSYLIGSYAWEDVVISHYIHPRYPSSFLSNAAYTSAQTAVTPVSTVLSYPAPTGEGTSGAANILFFGNARFRYEQMGQVLDEMAIMYPELYSVELKNAYPHNLGSCRVNHLTWLIPTKYRTATPYGNRIHPIYGDLRFHNGADLGAAQGTPIFAARSGTVRDAGYNDSAGNYVYLDHDGGYRTVYMHMVDRPLVTDGQKVTAGQVIGYVGNTGDSTSAHLHYEVWLNGSVQDPYDYLGLSGSGSVSGPNVIYADDTIDTTALVAAWNKIAETKPTKCKEAQLNIAAKLFVQPVSQAVTVSTGFNWTKTTLREEILWAVCTTSSKQTALISVMTSLCAGLGNDISDEALLEHLKATDFLVVTVAGNRENLWPDDPTSLQDAWINSIQLLLPELTARYAKPAQETQPAT